MTPDYGIRPDFPIYYGIQLRRTNLQSARRLLDFLHNIGSRPRQCVIPMPDVMISADFSRLDNFTAVQEIQVLASSRSRPSLVDLTAGVSRIRVVLDRKRSLMALIILQ